MVKYLDFHAPTGDVDVTPSVISPAISRVSTDSLRPAKAFRPWQPSTWPKPPAKVNESFINDLRKIFRESMLEEINNVMEDAKTVNGDLQHRGHVVGVALMCALDAVSSYGYRGKNGKHIAKFIRDNFPGDYRPFAGDIYRLYRNNMVHSWNLFQATILPGDEPVVKSKIGTLGFGLGNFFKAISASVESFLKKLETDPHIQTNTLNRFRKLRKTAKC